MPEISIIVCIYNQGKWIERCIRSIIHQVGVKKNDFEIILINDASTDYTKKILKNFRNFKNIKISHNTKNLGLPRSINKGIQLSSGRYVVRVDSDDYIERNYLAISKLFLDKNRHYHALATDYLRVDEDENLLSRENCFKKEIACGIMFRKEAILEIGLYNEKFLMREGHELKKRFERKFKIGRLELPLYKYRIYNKNRTNNKKKIKKYEEMLRRVQ
jgi:glycosyltransferase involved in cell wall biosynthesis